MSTQKLFVIIATLTLSLSSLATTKPSLWDKPYCQSEPIHCAVGKILAFDQVGRCGCLKAGDYIDPTTCRKAYIICDELHGETFATLMSNGEFIGCGCYKTN